MGKHLIGAILFSVIVGAAVVASKYFAVIPIVPEVIEPNDCALVFEETPKLNINQVFFYGKIQRFSATFSCKNTLPNQTVKDGDWGIKSASRQCIGEDKVLHFFAVKKGQSQYLFTQDVLMGIVSTSGNATTKPFEVGRLQKMKNFRNIYVNAEYKRNYKDDSIPIFVPEFAVPITKVDF